MKICSKCKLEKEDNQFPKQKNGKNGLYSSCLACKKKYKQQWYKDNGLEIARKPGVRFQAAKNQAKRRNLEWNIEREDYYSFLKQRCFYCYSALEETGTGLDRLDNNLGYNKSNVVPCCGPCNLGRGDRFTSEEWKAAVEGIFKYRALAQSD